MTDFELKKYIKLFPFKIKHTLYIYIYKYTFRIYYI